MDFCQKSLLERENSKCKSPWWRVLADLMMDWCVWSGVRVGKSSGGQAGVGCMGGQFTKGIEGSRTFL